MELSSPDRERRLNSKDERQCQEEIDRPIGGELHKEEEVKQVRFEFGHAKGRSDARADDSSNVVNPSERRRLQNQLAQKRFREKAKEDKEKQEGHKSNTQSLKGGPPSGNEARQKSTVEGNEDLNQKGKETGPDFEENPVARKGAKEYEDAEWSSMMWDEDDVDGPINIRCVCGYPDDKRHIVQCEKCGNWQHIACYYETAQHIVEVHECVECSPRHLEMRTDARMPNYRDRGDESTYGKASLPSGIRAKWWPVGKSSTATGSKNAAKSVANYTAATSEVGSWTPENDDHVELLQPRHEASPDNMRIDSSARIHICSAPGCSQSFLSLEKLRSHHQSHPPHSAHQPLSFAFVESDGVSTQELSTNELGLVSQTIPPTQPLDEIVASAGHNPGHIQNPPGSVDISSPEAEVEELASPPVSSSRSRERTGTGCLTCRNRIIACGEERHSCKNCRRTTRECEGYSPHRPHKSPNDLLLFSDSGISGPTIEEENELEKRLVRKAPLDSLLGAFTEGYDQVRNHDSLESSEEPGISPRRGEDIQMGYNSPEPTQGGFALISGAQGWSGSSPKHARVFSDSTSTVEPKASETVYSLADSSTLPGAETASEISAPTAAAVDGSIALWLGEQPHKSGVSIETAHYGGFDEDQFVLSTDVASSQRSPRPPSAAPPTTERSWSERLREHCRAHHFKNPAWRAISELRGRRTAWTAVVDLGGQSYPARFWYDIVYLEQAMEDASEVAWKVLVQESKEDSTLPGLEREDIMSHHPTNFQPSGHFTGIAEKQPGRRRLPALQKLRLSERSTVKTSSAEPIGTIAHRNATPKDLGTNAALVDTDQSILDTSPPRRRIPLLSNTHIADATSNPYYQARTQNSRTGHSPDPTSYSNVSTYELGTVDRALANRARGSAPMLKKKPSFGQSQSADHLERPQNRKAALNRSTTSSKLQALQGATKDIPEITFEPPETTSMEQDSIQFADHALRLHQEAETSQRLVKEGSSEVELLVQLALQSLSSTPDLTKKPMAENVLRWTSSSIGRVIGTLTRRYTVWEVIGPAKQIAIELSQMVRNILDESLIAEKCPGETVLFDTFMIGRKEENAQLAVVLISESRNLRKNAVEVVKQSGILKLLFPGTVILHMARSFHYLRPDDSWKRSRISLSTISGPSSSQESSLRDPNSTSYPKTKPSLASVSQYEPIPSPHLTAGGTHRQFPGSAVSHNDNAIVEATEPLLAATGFIDPTLKSLAANADPPTTKLGLDQDAGTVTNTLPRDSIDKFRSEGERWTHIHEITRPYKDENGTPLEVITSMDDRHGFKRRKAQYERKLKEWELRKYATTKEERKSIMRPIHERAAHTASSKLSGSTIRLLSKYDIPDSEPLAQKSIQHPSGAFLSFYTPAQTIDDPQRPPDSPSLQWILRDIHAPRSSPAGLSSTSVGGGDTEGTKRTESGEYPPEGSADLSDNGSIRQRGDEDPIEVAVEALRILTRTESAHTIPESGHHLALWSKLIQPIQEGSPLHEKQRKEQNSEDLVSMSKALLPRHVDGDSRSPSPKITIDPSKAKDKKLPNTIPEAEPAQSHIVATQLADEFETTMTKELVELSELGISESQENEYGRRWRTTTSGTLPPTAGGEPAQDFMKVDTKRAADLSPRVPGRSPTRSPQGRLEGRKAWSLRSYGSASIGTDIGNETDDTEWTAGGEDARTKGRTLGANRLRNFGAGMRLDALEEESSDEEMLSGEQGGHAEVGRKEEEGKEHYLKTLPTFEDEGTDVQAALATGTAEMDDVEDSATSDPPSLPPDAQLFETHLFTENENLEDIDWKDIRAKLPEDWIWDVDYTTTHSNTGKDHGCWTCTPTEPDDPKNFPLTISNTPVVLPVEYQWPPMAGVNPPPDPRPSAPIDCTVELSLEVVRDLFLTFEGSIGFYLLISGLLQIMVTEEFDTQWASSHLPHKYGGLKVCYILQTMEPTMFQVPSKTETMKSKASHASQSSSMSGILRSSSSRATSSSVQPLQINDFIEARTKSSSKKEKFAGRIGLKVQKCGDPYLVMSTHVITEAILAKSHIGGLFGRRDRLKKLDGDWNEHIEIWAGNERIGTINQTFDKEAEIYPNGFDHDITLIKPANTATVKDIASPLPDLGWLSLSSWHSLRQRSAHLKILGPTETHRASKTLKSSRPSEVLVVGEGIFLNQASSKPTRDHDIATWKDLVSRAVLYRVYPDFDPPNGYSGVALYAEGTREDGTEGPGVVGFQSFVQRSGHVQSFEMEGGALEKRLKLGRVAFYGAFMVPEALKREYGVV